MAMPNKEDVARAVAYRESILAKTEASQPLLTCAEKRFLLRTGSLAYKALAFPESLTPAQRNRIRYSPPPSQVTANILRATHGALSTAEELYEKVLRDSSQCSEEELTLITRNLFLPASTQEAQARRTWQNKTSADRAWNLAFNRVTTEMEAEAHRAAVREEMKAERVEQKRRGFLERMGVTGDLEMTGEQRERYHERERMAGVEAGKRLREWEGEDEKLEVEVREEMRRMADGMGEGGCSCCDGEGEVAA